VADIYTYPADRAQRNRSRSKRKSLGGQIIKLLQVRADKIAAQQKAIQKENTIKVQKGVIEQSESLVRQLRYELAKMIQRGGN
jgi:hypothetical protein